jgi:predicted nucleotidyltransferase
MRLTAEEQRRLKAVAERVFGPRVEAYVFGSRVDDSRRGGDVDVYCVLPERPADLARREARFQVEAEAALDGLTVDVVVRTPQTPISTIHRYAERTGVRL